MNKLHTIFALGLLLFASISLNAQKFGYINSQQLIQQIPQVKQANASLETMQKQFEKSFTDKANALQTKYQALLRKQDQGEISPKQFEVEGQALEAEKMELAKSQQDMQQKLAAKSEELLKPIRDSISEAIKAVATENGFTYIFDQANGLILYAEDSADVGHLVKAKLGL